MAKGTVLAVTPNQTFEGRNGPYTVTLLKYQPDPYKGQAKAPVEKRIFPNADYHDVVLQLKPGDYIQVDFTQQGQFKNVSNVSLVRGAGEQPPQGAQPAGPVLPVPAIPPRQKDAPAVSEPSPGGPSEDDHKRWSRENAISVASSLTEKLIEHGFQVFKKTASVDVIASQVVVMASMFDEFTRNGMSESMRSLSSEKKTARKKEDPPVNLPEVPMPGGAPEEDIPY